jgi:hypothetical protein
MSRLGVACHARRPHRVRAVARQNKNKTKKEPAIRITFCLSLAEGSYFLFVTSSSILFLILLFLHLALLLFQLLPLPPYRDPVLLCGPPCSTPTRQPLPHTALTACML